MIDNPHLDASSYCLRAIPPVVLAACAFFAAMTLLAAPAFAAPAPKIEICHRPHGNPDNWHTITISDSALAAHLEHDDFMGPCNAFCAELCTDHDPCTEDDPLGWDCEEQGCPPVPRAAVICPPQSQCIGSVCDSAQGGCVNVFVPQGEPCDDGMLCTSGDSCDGQGHCKGGMDIPNCCVDDSWCSFCPEPGTGTGFYCGDDNTCQSYPEHPCDDHVQCTVEICSEDTDTCQREPINELCDDEIYCTIDVCDVENDCQHMADDDLCNDGIVCTINEFCDPVTGCGRTADDSLCDDGIACTSEVCDPNAGCISTAHDSACDDGDRCTIDKCDPSSPSPDGCRHDEPLDSNCCNSDGDCQPGEVCDESTPIPHCEPAPPTCFTASDCIGLDTQTCRQMCLAVAECDPLSTCDNFDPILHPEFAGTVDQCINQGIETACDDIDAYGRDFCDNVCPLQTPGSACPCWDGSATSVNGVSNVVELWNLYGPTECSQFDFCFDVTNQLGIAGNGTQAQCVSSAGAEMTTTAFSDANQGFAQCWVQIDGQILVEETFPIGSSQADACIAEHDALITLGGTFPYYQTATCGLGSF